MTIDYADYGAKLTTPREIAAVEGIPLQDVLNGLKTEEGKEYYAALANTVIFLKSQLILKIQSDPDSIGLLKNLTEINKVAERLNVERASQDTIRIICDKLGVETLEDAPAAIDSLKLQWNEVFRRLDTHDINSTLFAIDMLLQK